MESFIEFGYLGLFMASFLAATILPIGSEPVLMALLYANLDPILLMSVATLGNTLGGLTSFGLGYLGKWEWVEKRLKISEKQMLKSQKYIDKFGVWAALLTWVPFIGDPIAVTLGFFKLNIWKVAVLMLIGKFLRYYLIVFWFGS
ncbi:MAG: YqaA family protein [Salibacteraceae bacterium]